MRKIETVILNRKKIAILSCNEEVITDVQSALDLMMNVKYEAGAEALAINKAAVTEAFFILSSGLAGEILQKFINYHIKIAIYGDYSNYTSKPLKDFIYESNCGNDIFFSSSLEEALQYLENSLK